MNDIITEWFPSDLTKLSQYQPKEWLPFKNSHQQAINNLCERSLALEDHQVLFAWHKGNQLLALCDVDIIKGTLSIHNILSLSSQFGFQECFLMLETIAKSRRLNTIFLPDFSDVSLAKEKLIAYGFLWKNSPKKGYYFNLTYHTGVVLGGGGARGSYQVGAWQAMRQLNISYDMVSGTSVGALNGALMVQGDYKEAANMWREIATKKILNLSLDATQNKTRENLVQGVKVLTLSALKENGVDTTPLYQMIEKMLDEEKLFQSKQKPIEFVFAVTQAPKMEEKDISLNDVPKNEISKWLLASSSFYPAMKACEINGHYYVDGGYRNNIPKDLLLKRGATELIVVDVKGPGFIKPTKIPRNVTETVVSSKWGLGTVLLFDKERANWNMTLGYLETLKAFHVYRGSWYTISSENYKKEGVKLTKDFLTYLNHSPLFKRVNRKVTPRWIAQRRIQPEVFGVYLLEELAKSLSANPSQIYTLNSLEKEVLKLFEDNKIESDGNMLYSLGEWMAEYFRQNAPVTEKKILDYTHHLVTTNSDVVERLFDFSWKPVLQAMFICFIKERNQ